MEKKTHILVYRLRSESNSTEDPHAYVKNQQTVSAAADKARYKQASDTGRLRWLDHGHNYMLNLRVLP